MSLSYQPELPPPPALHALRLHAAAAGTQVSPGLSRLAPRPALSDVELHQAIKFSPAGKQLLALGKRGQSGSGPDRFCKPTQVAVGRTGAIYVSGEPCAPCRVRCVRRWAEPVCRAP